MKVILLADDPGSAPAVAQWYFDEWCRESGRYSLEQVRQKVDAAASRDKLPMLMLAKDLHQLLGAAELKTYEMERYPEYQYWLGGVYVSEHARGQGVASSLVHEAIKRARLAGMKHLYLQTEDLSGGLYAKFGFKKVHQIVDKGDDVIVMKLDI
ncbi:GNAT family N-acetyltransferase [Shewanella maritima]|uniref:GNAT family N-acetyltransferase n=1 Tax=Shewanella maritima TaxID=2520507 RepID=A0A411PMG9_9GAMM|nr:GNAT family N-acetyltransferase [Shewanella maritima]QBF84678.1 GNAT family N-acetyltransferase [Shewanella maritima]